MPTCKVLVVDDFEPIRRLVCSVLEQNTEFQVIGQAADGLEAIQKAEELQPDLVVLDISLPKLNGIAAARQIRTVVPKSRILFFSENTSSQTVEAALGTGASGYIVKSDAGEELLRAVAAVSQGRQFLSRRLEGLSADVKDTRTPGSVRHEAHFYSDNAELLDGFADFIAVALRDGKAAIVVATESRRNALFSKLQSRGLDISSERDQGNYIALDVAETLSGFMVNGLPDWDRFFGVVGDLLRTVARTGKTESRRIAACGEIAPTLWAEGHVDAAIRIEQLWDQIATIYGIDTLCGYELSSFHGEEDQDAFQSICAEHSAARSQGKALAVRPYPHDKPLRLL